MDENYLKENFSESTKLSSIQRNFSFDPITKKLFSGCNFALKKSNIITKGLI